MADVTPREAFGYALGREMLAMYALFLVGYAMFAVAGWLTVRWAWRGGLGNVAQLVALLLSVAGTLTVVGASVGIAYKVIADATTRGNRADGTR